MNLQLWTMVSLKIVLFRLLVFILPGLFIKKTNKEQISLLESILFKSLRYSGITW